MESSTGNEPLPEDVKPLTCIVYSEDKKFMVPLIPADIQSDQTSSNETSLPVTIKTEIEHDDYDCNAKNRPPDSVYESLGTAKIGHENDTDFEGIDLFILKTVDVHCSEDLHKTPDVEDKCFPKVYLVSRRSVKPIVEFLSKLQRQPKSKEKKILGNKVVIVREERAPENLISNSSKSLKESYFDSFKYIFCINFKDAGFDVEDVNNLINFVYSGRLVLSLQNAGRMLRLVSHLDIPEVLRMLETYLATVNNEKTCEQIYHILMANESTVNVSESLSALYIDLKGKFQPCVPNQNVEPEDYCSLKEFPIYYPEDTPFSESSHKRMPSPNCLQSQNCQSEQSSEGLSDGEIDFDQPAPSANGILVCGVKRKIDTKTIEVKYNAILEVEKGLKTKAQIARDLKINSSTLSTWLKNAASIKEGYLTFNPKRKSMKTGKWEELETAVYKWVKFATDNKTVLNGSAICAKAKQYAESMNISDFQVSSGWLDRFKERKGIVFRSRNGESESLNDTCSGMKDWKIRLETISHKYNVEDIFNADETGLFYKLLPEKMQEFKLVNCNRGKWSKERLTVMVCANMTGMDKLPLLVIGKSSKPRCFKNVKTLPTQYKSNKNAWMNGELFHEWLRDLDKVMMERNRRIALIVDSAPCHPKVQWLNNIELIFLPPRTTGEAQPMDQGVIQNLKSHYRKRVILRQLSSIDQEKPFTLSVLDAMRLLQQSWECVTQTIIANCFSYTEFTPSYNPQDDDDCDKLGEIAHARLASIGISSTMLESYLEFSDDGARTCSLATDDEIISETMKESGMNDLASTTDDDDDDSCQSQPPTADEAMEALSTLQRFFETRENTQTESEILCKLSRSLLRAKNNA